MLFLELFLDMIVYIAVHGGGPIKEGGDPMEEVGALTIGHLRLWISSSIDLANGIPIGTNTVRHESLEVHNQDPIPSHDFVKAPPHDTLDLTVLRLHITYCNSHHSAIL